MAVILQQRDSPSFRARVEWERLQDVLFARTMRQFMRDPGLYSAENLWTDALCAVADLLLKLAAMHPDMHSCADFSALLHAESAVPPDTGVVWDRFQHWPFSVELQHARLQANCSTAVPKVQPPAEGPEPDITDGGWVIKRHTLSEWLDTGTLDLALWEFFARQFRSHLPSNICLYLPHALASSTRALAMSRILKLPARLRLPPAVRIYPVRSSAHVWAAFLYFSADGRLVALLPNTASQVPWTREMDLLQSAFQTTDCTTLRLDNTQSTDFAFFEHILAYLSHGGLADDVRITASLCKGRVFASELLAATSAQCASANLLHLQVTHLPLSAARRSLFQHVSEMLEPPACRKTKRPRSATPKTLNHVGPPLTETPSATATLTAASTIQTSAPCKKPWTCPPNPHNIACVGRQVLQKPRWFNDAASGMIGQTGCQCGATCGLLAITHILRNWRLVREPITLTAYQLSTGDMDEENFDLFNLLNFAATFGLRSAPLPTEKPRAAYLLHSLGHFVSLVPTRLGTLLCDSLHPLPFICTTADVATLLRLFQDMQASTAHVDIANPNRGDGWMGMCLWRDPQLPSTSL